MNSQSLKWRIPLIVLIMAACLYYAIPPFDPDGSGPRQGKIKLGLDLQGGMHLVLRVDTSALPEKEKRDAVARAIEIIRNRIDQFGVSEPSIQAEGVDRIIVQLPGVTDRQRALDLVGKTALLEFKLVTDDNEKVRLAQEGKVPEGYELVKSKDSGDLLIENKATVTGKHVKDAQPTFGQYSEPEVAFEFNPEGGKIFGELTARSIGRRLAIVLDGVVQSAPVIQSRISDRGVITGRFTYEEASDLAITLRAGALPAPIVIEEDRAVGPSLGKDSVDKGIHATLVGFVLVVAFMLFYYLLGGLVANIALLLNIIITLAALSYFHATLTLPGIAGIVLTIGIAVDANVLIFERIREELALKKPFVGALVAGYHRAFATILDSHVTTLITAGILYFMGTGPIRGFALTLSIGIAASLFTAVFVTRVIFEILITKGGLNKLTMLHFLPKTPSLDYLKVRKICYLLSFLVIAAGMTKLVMRGDQMFGVDFLGGTMQEYRFNDNVHIEEVRKSLTEVGLGDATIQQVGTTESRFIIRAPIGSDKTIAEVFKKDFAGKSYEMLRSENVGPIVGKELKVKALWAIFLSLFGIWLYVIWRFDFKFAFGAVLSLLHDALITVACVALSGRELSVPVLAAILTILGYSINDTIVIFDRIRERRRTGIKETFEQAINASINLTMARTILTTLTVILVVAALYFFGGEVINDFAFTMLFGVITGTYSTVYIAAPVLMDWPGNKKK